MALFQPNPMQPWPSPLGAQQLPGGQSQIFTGLPPMQMAAPAPQGPPPVMGQQKKQQRPGAPVMSQLPPLMR